MSNIEFGFLPDDRPLSIFLRHAERPAMKDNEVGEHLALTVTGVLASRALGSQIGSRLSSVCTSPIRRCVETAEYIVAASGCAIPIQRTSLLGDPGAFVERGDLAWQNWERLGNSGVIQHLMESDKPLPGMRHPDVAVGMLLDAAKKALEQDAGVHLFVTHDAILAPLISRLYGRPLSDADWPDFLHALCVWKEGARLVASYGLHTWGILGNRGAIKAPPL